MQTVIHILMKVLAFPVALAAMLAGIAMVALILQAALCLLLVFLVVMAIWTMLAWLTSGERDKPMSASLAEVFR